MRVSAAGWWLLSTSNPPCPHQQACSGLPGPAGSCSVLWLWCHPAQTPGRNSRTTTVTMVPAAMVFSSQPPQLVQGAASSVPTLSHTHKPLPPAPLSLHLRTPALVREALPDREGHKDGLCICCDGHRHCSCHGPTWCNGKLLHVYKCTVAVAAVHMHHWPVALCCWRLDALHSIHHHHGGAVCAECHLHRQCIQAQAANTQALQGWVALCVEHRLVGATTAFAAAYQQAPCHWCQPQQTLPSCLAAWLAACLTCAPKYL